MYFLNVIRYIYICRENQSNIKRVKDVRHELVVRHGARKRINIGIRHNALIQIGRVMIRNIGLVIILTVLYSILIQ